ncbi:MAG: ADP-ribose diphosphatase, partial [Pseudomonadales bacterium]
LFCGRVDASAAGGVFGLRHEHEDIAVIALPLLEALDLVDRGKINNAMSIIALQWLRLNKAALLSQWKVRR